MESSAAVRVGTVCIQGQHCRVQSTPHPQPPGSAVATWVQRCAAAATVATSQLAGGTQLLAHPATYCCHDYLYCFLLCVLCLHCLLYWCCLLGAKHLSVAEVHQKTSPASTARAAAAAAAAGETDTALPAALLLLLLRESAAAAVCLADSHCRSYPAAAAEKHAAQQQGRLNDGARL